MDRIQILFLDSGTGGLPYMLRLKELAPEVRCVYIGDTANFPYGEKTLAQIECMARETTERAIKCFNPQIVVVACNTMSVAALKSLRASFDLPFVGTVPAIKLAAKSTQNKKIGLLATRHTIEDPYTEDLISQNLYCADILPDVDLMVRTSGEMRTSNFHIWRGAYSELYFTPALWPEFDSVEMVKAILAYQNRERRFGMTSEQVQE